MSNSNGTSYTARSMNGIITYDDGQGTVISDGTITTQSLSLNNILAASTNLACSLFSNIVSGIIQIGSSTTASLTVKIGRFLSITDAGINSTSSLTIGSTSGVNLGSTTGYVRSAYAPVATTDITTVSYVASYVAGRFTNFLGLSNVWTGTINQFNNKIKTNTLESILTADIMNIGTNITGLGKINIGVSTIPVKISNINMNGTDISPSTSSTFSIGSTLTTVLNLGSASIPVKTSYIATQADDVLNYATGQTLTNALLTNLSNEWTGTLNAFDQEIKNNNLQSALTNGSMLIGTGLVAGGSLALGSYASTIKLGGYELVSNGMDMTSSALSKQMSIGFATATSVAIGAATIPVITAYNATQDTHVVNLRTLNNSLQPYASTAGSNVFTGLTNSFNTIRCASIQPNLTTMDIADTLVLGGVVTIGTSVATTRIGSIYILGNNISLGVVGTLTLGESGVLVHYSNIPTEGNELTNLAYVQEAIYIRINELKDNTK